LKVLDLFSGIGGFSLGLERAGMETVAFCENDKKARQVLKKNWPGVPIYSDVRRVGEYEFKKYAIELISAGFPCPAFSMSGVRGGFEQDDLFFEIVRLTKELQPKWVILENVEGFRKWRREAIKAFKGIDYELEDGIFDARDFGIPQARRRWFAVCVRRGVLSDPQHLWRFQGIKTKNLHELFTHLKDPKGRWTPTVRTKEEWRAIAVNARASRDHHGISGRVDRLKQLGNAVVPQVVEIIGRAIMEADRVF